MNSSIWLVIAGGGVVGAILLLVAVLVWLASKRARDARVAQAWARAVEATRHGARLVFVERLYERAQRGSKALLVSWPDGARQDAWFDGLRVAQGTYLLFGPASEAERPGTPSDATAPMATLPGNAPALWALNRHRLL
ncbi:MAG: hypothetical protein WAS07_02170 [Micropruina sp.]